MLNKPISFWVCCLLSTLTFINAFQTPTSSSTSNCNTNAVTKLQSQSTTSMVECLDEEALFSSSTYSTPPQDLINRAKQVLSPQIGLGTKDDGECLAPDFRFVAAVVGPIGREDYLNALGNFNLENSFDIVPNYYGFSVDPMQPNRVWFFNRNRATHTGTFMGAPASGKKIEYPPQVLHIDFDQDGDKITEFGFYTADRMQGNTGGLGGAFGFMYGVGKPLPIPECQPYKPSKRFRFFIMLGNVGKFFANIRNKKE